MFIINNNGLKLMDYKVTVMYLYLSLGTSFLKLYSLMSEYIKLIIKLID